MKIYHAGSGSAMAHALLKSNKEIDLSMASRVNVLMSFYYPSDWQTKNIHNFKSFMLDSGAFSFVYGAKKSVDMSTYFDRYKRYVKENNVPLFFELDIDELVGYDKVLEYRANLEKYVGRRCIPVWHTNRGKNEWLRMCDEYDYVAIGGIADKGRKSIEKYIPWFTKEAHKRGAKVHGLGYTSLSNLPRMMFDSVDSSSWLYGNIGAYVYIWDGREMKKVGVPKGKKMKTHDVLRHNFIQWVKMAEYLEG